MACARPLRRIFQRDVEDPLSFEILKGRFSSGSTVVVDAKDEAILFRPKRSPKAEKGADEQSSDDSASGEGGEGRDGREETAGIPG